MTHVNNTSTTVNGTGNDDSSKKNLNAGGVVERKECVGDAAVNSRREAAVMPLAIVGMACRLPGGVHSTDDLWQMCALGRSGWSEMPADRFTHESYYHPDAGRLGTYNAKGGHFLEDDVGLFDAAFFNITAQEAVALDPQQRLLLECTYEALESGGITKQSVAGTNTGVYVGGSTADYEHHCFRDIRTSPMYASTGCQPSILSNRLSYCFDLRGPSLTIDTACSSSLVALHMACQSLRSGEVSQAIVGGVHLNLSPDNFVSMSNQRLFGSEGRCFSFDHRATSGYGPGEGVGCIVVKPLDEALAARNSIRAVILNSGTNQDGRTEGITAPNQQAQESLIRSVYRTAGLDTKDTGYVEAHGTGTKVGDPIEAAALHAVFGNERSPQHPLLIGSVKSNIGHLEGASGIISIIKAALILEKGFVLPNCDFQLPNPSIALRQWNLKVTADQRPWPRSKRFVSVNNFGFGGANCHVVLEKAPRVPRAVSARQIYKSIITEKGTVETIVAPNIAQPWMQHLYVFTANDRKSLEDQIKVLEIYLEQRPEVFEGSLMRRLAYTLYELSKDADTSLLDLAYISQPACTALQLALVDLLKSWGIRPAAVVGHSSGEIAGSYAAGALSLESCMKIAFFRGQVTKAFKSKCPKLHGAMLAVGCDENEIKPYLESLKTGKVVVAAINSPASLTVSGDEDGILELQGILEEKSVFNRKLRVNMAYHSHHMELIAQDYLDLLADITPLDVSEVDFYSTVTGTTIESLVLQPLYWVANLISTVRFSEATANLCGKASGDARNVPIDILIEIGPHSALEGPVKQTIKSKLDDRSLIDYASCLIRNKNAVETSLQLAAKLCASGCPLNYKAVNFPFGDAGIEVLTDMDPYSWQHSTRYWHESRITQNYRLPRWPRHDLLGTLVDETMNTESEWKNILRLCELPWLEHHSVQSNCVFPLAGYVALGLEAINQRATMRNLKYDTLVLQDFSISHPLVLYPTTDVEIRTTIRPHNEGVKTSSALWEDFQVSSWTSRTGWLEHCQALIGVRPSSDDNPVEGNLATQHDTAALVISRERYSQACKTHVDITELYRTLAATGFAAGDTFQGMRSCQASGKYAITEVEVTDTRSLMPEEYESDYVVHPSTLDSITQAVWPIIGAGRIALRNLFLPSSFKSMSISNNMSKAPGASLHVYCSGAEGKSDKVPIDFSFFATESRNATRPLIKIDGYTMTPVQEGVMQNFATYNKGLCYKLDWEPVGAASSETPELVPLDQPNGTLLRAVSQSPDISIITLDGRDTVRDVHLTTLIEAVEIYTAKKPTLNCLGDGDIKGKILVVLIEMERPCLAAMTPTMFQSLQDIVTKASGILWPIQRGYQGSAFPDSNMVSGFARTVRSESALKFVTVDLDLHQSDPTDTAKAIAEVFRRSFVGSSIEMEYMERQGSLYVPRLIPDLSLGDFVRWNTGVIPVQAHSQKFFQSGRNLKLSIAHPGSLETLQFIDTEALRNPIGACDIEIEVKAIGLNFKDVVIAMGQLPGGLLGQECSGIVTAVGSQTTRFKVGDRVCAISPGCLANLIHCKATSAVCVPDNMSFDVAATLPLIYCTAYYSLLDIGRLVHDEKVLIHAAAGGVGQAAVGLAQMVGAEVFATVGSASKKSFLMEKFGVREDHIFYSRDTSFKAGIMRMTNNKGVDVVLNSLAGNALHTTLECLTAFGRFIEIGKRDIVDNSRLMMAPFARNIVFASVDLAVVATERPQLMQALFDNVLDLYRSGRLRLVSPLTTFSMSEVESAIRTLQGGKSIGKIVVVPEIDDKVKASPPRLPSNLLHAEATYIIIGGTGGIGRSLAEWMVGKGARHVVLVSRSGTNGKVEKLKKDMEASNARLVVHRCDVGDKEEVAALIELIRSEMPPIRGLIHSAMVLHDTLFENLAYEQYQSVIRPKVGGAWNLHHGLSDTALEFFIILSSASGIVGNRGQVAYAAANTFLDAFAQYRRSQGLPATAIDLAAVKNIGYLAENEEKAALVRETFGDIAVGKEELHMLVAAAIMGQIHDSCNDHCITGLGISQDSSMPIWMSDSKFERIRPADVDLANVSQPTAIPVRQAVSQATSLEEVQQLIQDALVAKVAAVVLTPVDEIDPTRSITVYGLDSLVAIEIRNWITRELKANLQVLELLSSGSLLSLSTLIMKRSKLVEEVPKLKELVEKLD